MKVSVGAAQIKNSNIQQSIFKKIKNRNAIIKNKFKK